MTKKNEMRMKINEVVEWSRELMFSCRGFWVSWDGLYTTKETIRKRYKDGDKVRLYIGVDVGGVRFCACKSFERVKGTDELRMDNDMVVFYPYYQWCKPCDIWDEDWDENGERIDGYEGDVAVYMGTDWRNVKQFIYRTSDYIEHYEEGEEWKKLVKDSEFDRLENQIRLEQYYNEEVCA